MAKKQLWGIAKHFKTSLNRIRLTSSYIECFDGALKFNANWVPLSLNTSLDGSSQFRCKIYDINYCDVSQHDNLHPVPVFECPATNSDNLPRSNTRSFMSAV